MAAFPARHRVGAAVAAAGLLGLAGCGGGDAAGGCGATTRESLDPAFLVHVLGDDDTVEYTSDPPTSGPHQPGPPITGPTTEPIPRPVQVGILERGDVLIQYQPSLGVDALAALDGLAGTGVVVAPNPELPDPVVATAWLFKRACAGADLDGLRQFIEERAGRGPEG